MLSKNRIAFLRSLQQKKFRREEGLFIAEGTKNVRELLASSIAVESLLATADWWAQHRELDTPALPEAITTDAASLERISSLSTAPDVLGVFRIPDWPVQPQALLSDYTLVADGIRDPGNLGTLIRIADWFGIRQVVCSTDSAEIWNPKTVQATMGSLARVRVSETDLPALFEQLQQLAGTHPLPVYGAYLNGAPIYSTQFAQRGLLVIGSESHGISAPVRPFITHAITIPAYGSGAGAESLNAGVAAGIICGELRRQLHQH